MLSIICVTPHLVSQIIMEVDYFTALPQEHVHMSDDLIFCHSHGFTSVVCG